MKPGDMVTLVKVHDYIACLNLWGEPRVFIADCDSQFFSSDIGIVLDQRNVPNNKSSTTSWIKLLCPGGVGWTYESDLILLQSF